MPLVLVLLATECSSLPRAYCYDLANGTRVCSSTGTVAALFACPYLTHFGVKATATLLPLEVRREILSPSAHRGLAVLPSTQPVCLFLAPRSSLILIRWCSGSSHVYRVDARVVTPHDRYPLCIPRLFHRRPHHLHRIHHRHRTLRLCQEQDGKPRL